MQKIIIMLAVFALGGCALSDSFPNLMGSPERERPDLLPYHFNLVSMDDKRIEKNEDTYPMNQSEITQILVTSLNTNLYSLTPANLSAEITYYKTYIEAQKFNVELGFHLKGWRPSGTVLAEGDYECVSSGTQPFKLDGWIQRKIDGVKFTERQRTAKIWTDLTQKCLGDVMNSFNNTVLSAKGS